MEQEDSAKIASQSSIPRQAFHDPYQFEFVHELEVKIKKSNSIVFFWKNLRLFELNEPN